MVKKDFVAKAAEKADFTKADIETALAAICETIEEVIATNESIRLSIGTFSGVDTEAKTGRNPSTGEVLNIPAKTGVAKFKFSSTVKKLATPK